MAAIAKQQSLFATPEDDAADIADPRKLARSTDPSTSHDAAHKAVEDGTVAGHEARILAALRTTDWPLTYREIARIAGLEPPAVMRRLKSMSERALIAVTGERHCSWSRTKCTTWRIR